MSEGFPNDEARAWYEKGHRDGRSSLLRHSDTKEAELRSALSVAQSALARIAQTKNLPRWITKLAAKAAGRPEDLWVELVRERDALKARVAELEGEVDRALALAQDWCRRATSSAEQQVDTTATLRERVRKAEARVAELEKVRDAAEVLPWAEGEDRNGMTFASTESQGGIVIAFSAAWAGLRDALDAALSTAPEEPKDG